MKKILLLFIISSFLISQSLTKGWYNESFDVPGTLWTNALEVLGGTPGVGKVLTDDGTGLGVAIWSAAAGGGANTALSNLASVAINTSLILGASDGGALGSVTKQWSDLFLASGGVINWNNGDMTITHAANVLDIEGGKVGIGTPTPNAALEVKGALPGSVGGFQSGTFHVTNSSAAQYSNSVITGHNAYNTNTQLWYLGSVSSSNNDIAFINRQVGVIGFDTNNTRRMTILSGGNVGMGESSPLDILHVTKNNACIRLEDDSGNYGRVKVGNSQLTIQADPDNVVASTDIVFDMDGSEVARFLQGGNFGIGVTDPDHLLEIFGTATQQKTSYDALNYATQTVDIEGRYTVTTVDADAAEGDIVFMPDGFVGIGTASPLTKLHIEGDLHFTPREQQALVTFIFDDGNDSDINVMKPLFDAKSEVACSAIKTSAVGSGNHLTWANLTTLESAGWEILSHTVNHPDLTAISADSARWEISVSKDTLEARGLTIDNFAYPGGDNNETVRRITREYYRSSRGISGNINEQILTTYNLRSENADNHTRLAEFKVLVDAAESQLKWLIFYAHDTNTDDSTTIAALIDYIQAKPISIVTVDQGLNLVGNILDIGVGFAVGEKGLSVATLGIGLKESNSPLEVVGSGAFITAYNSYTGLLISSANAAAGDGNFGSGLEFLALGGAAKKRAAIVPKQYGGDNDDMGLSFFVANTDGIGAVSERMVITDLGNVGIGVTDPDSTLEVNGSGHFTDNLRVEGVMDFSSGYTRHIDVEIGAATLGPTAPTAVTVGTFRGLGFDADNEEAFVNYEIPADWDGASDMAFELHWYPTAGDVIANGETVKWDATYRSIAAGEAVDNGTVVSTTSTFTGGASETDKEHYETSITIDYDNVNQPLTAGDDLGIQFDRDVTTDTYSGAGIVYRIDLTYTSNTLPEN